MLSEPSRLTVEGPEEGRVYRHYRGERFRVVGRMEPDVVVCRSLESGEFRVQPVSRFIEPVCWTDGATRPRFVPLMLAPLAQV